MTQEIQDSSVSNGKSISIRLSIEYICLGWLPCKPTGSCISLHVKKEKLNNKKNSVFNAVGLALYTAEDCHFLSLR